MYFTLYTNKIKYKHAKIYINTLNIHKSNLYIYINTHRQSIQATLHCSPCLDCLNAAEISTCSSGQCTWDWYFSLTSSAIKWVLSSYPDPPCCLFLSALPHPTSSNLPELDSTQLWRHKLNRQLLILPTKWLFLLRMLVTAKLWLYNVLSFLVGGSTLSWWGSLSTPVILRAIPAVA